MSVNGDYPANFVIHLCEELIANIKNIIIIAFAWVLSGFPSDGQGVYQCLYHNKVTLNKHYSYFYYIACGNKTVYIQANSIITTDLTLEIKLCDNSH